MIVKLITSPAGAVAEYCDEYVCVCVCLSARISPNHTRDLYIARSSSIRVMKSQGEAAILGVLFPIDNALYSIAFGTHTKMTEPIEIPFGMMSGLGPRNSVLRGGDDLRRVKGQFLGKASAR